MVKKLDKMFCILMVMAASGHLMGTFKMLEPGTGIFVWSLSGVVAALLLASINFLRNSRPQDKTVTALALVGNISWLVIVFLFGQSIGNLFDFRVLFHGVAALGLAIFSLRNLL